MHIYISIRIGDEILEVDGKSIIERKKRLEDVFGGSTNASRSWRIDHRLLAGGAVQTPFVSSTNKEQETDLKIEKRREEKRRETLPLKKCEYCRLRELISRSFRRRLLN
jgi:hypothetical protein